MVNLPILDLSHTTHSAVTLPHALRESLHKVGFCYLKGHGLGAHNSALSLLFAQAKTFFALPDREKESISMLHSPHFRGYTRLGGERTSGLIDWREQIDIGPELPAIPHARQSWNLQGPNQWPHALPSLRPAVEKYCHQLERIGQTVLRLLALSFGVSPEYFEKAFYPIPESTPHGYEPRPATLLKIVHYPSAPVHPESSPHSEQGVGAHKDSGVLTLLASTPESVGLQVDIPSRGWTDIPSIPDALVVNIGELLHVATGGYLRATSHRVLRPPPGSHRLSLPFFYNPALGSSLPVVELNEKLRADIHHLPPEADNPIFDTYGENAWKSRMRAHPDVAHTWHAPTSARSV